MVESRWLRWIGPGVVALGAVGLIASSTARGRSRARGRRRPVRARRVHCPRRPATLGPAIWRDLAVVPWFRQDPVIDGGGDLARPAAWRSASTGTGWPGPWTCPPNRSPPGRSAVSSWSAPMTARRPGSRRSTSPMRCSWAVAEERDVIRRATVDPAGTIDLEMRVDRVSRADLGIWLRPIDGRTRGPPDPGAHRRPTAGSGGHGRPSSRGRWQATELAIQSCGEAACRTRIIRPDAAAVAASATMLDAPDLGLARRRRRGPGRDLCGVPRVPLPDRRDGRPKRRPAHAGRRCRCGGPRRHAGRDAAGPRATHCNGPAAPRTAARRRRDAGRPRRHSRTTCAWSRRRSHPAPRPRCRRAGSCSARTAGSRPMRPHPDRSSATSRTAWPSRWTRRRDDDPDPIPTRPSDPPRGASVRTRHRRVLLALAMTGRRGRRARAGPDVERRPVRPGPGPALPLASRLGTDRRDQDGHQGGGRRRHRQQGLDTPRRSPMTPPARTRSATARAPRAGSTGWPVSPATHRTGSRCGCASRATSSTGARSSGARRTPLPRMGATTPRRSRWMSSVTWRA